MKIGDCWKMQDMIEELKLRLQKLKGKTDSEENLKVHITMWLLEKLGYDRDDMDFEHSLCRKDKVRYADIYVQLNGNNGLFVETKKYGKDLEWDDIKQLEEYMNMHQIIWGILTNGRQYYLINSSTILNGSKNDVLGRVVLYVEIGIGKGKGKNEKYLKYYSEKNIFEDKGTYFYRDIAQFFAFHQLKDSSKEKYENTLYNFFDYYVQGGHKYTIYNWDRHLALEEVTVNDVIDFLKAERPFGRPYSGNVPKAKCAHTITMFQVLEEMGYIGSHRVKNLLERAYEEFEVKDGEENFCNLLTKNNINTILNKLKETNKPNKIMIFTLCSYYGFDRNTIVEFFALPWECVDFLNHKFMLHGRNYHMVSLLENALHDMKEKYKSRGIKAKAIYVSKKGSRYLPVNKDSVNAVFDEDIKKINEGDESWKLFNPQNTRALLISAMFDSGCSLEEISYLTGASVSQILRYVTNEQIIKAGEKRWKNGSKKGKDNHPFKDIFDEVL